MLVKTASMYAAIYDQRSPVNVEGFMLDLLNRAEKDPAANSFSPGGSLFIFNDYLTQHAQRGEMLCWTLPLDGVFDCDAEVAPKLPPPPTPIQNIGLDQLTGRLHAPTGRLVVSCLGDLGKPRPPILRVAPGTYDVALKRIEEIESKHWFLRSEADYPRGDGPDWIIRISRVDDASAAG